MIDFTNINYLKTGSQRQKDAFNALMATKILSQLSEFDALLAGTIPINIAIETSDLDIICFWDNKKHFIDLVKQLFDQKTGFQIRETNIDNTATVIANFTAERFEFEIFGQNIPVKTQNAYRHMVIEHEILEKKGENFRNEIIALKRQGHKTEPAFGILLGLQIDPYKELLDYKI